LSAGTKGEAALFGRHRVFLAALFATVAAFIGTVLAFISLKGGQVSQDAIVIAASVATAVSGLATALFGYVLSRRGDEHELDEMESEDSEN
jgi:hypothetical protein